jgi:hypothetical protein
MNTVAVETARTTKPIRLNPVPLYRLVRRFWCGLRGHRVWLYNADGTCAIKGRDDDGMVMADCGKPLKAICGLSLPGFRLGTNPRPANETALAAQGVTTTDP